MATNMDTILTFDRSARPTAPGKLPTHLVADDKAMLRTAAELTRDLTAPRPAIYWA
ncbi:MAG: fatty acid desaturase, partial [Sphingomonas sp.]